jgi:hypothetical protein
MAIEKKAARCQSPLHDLVENAKVSISTLSRQRKRDPEQPGRRVPVSEGNLSSPVWWTDPGIKLHVDCRSLRMLATPRWEGEPHQQAGLLGGGADLVLTDISPGAGR